jgi:hypothetical protein
MRTLVESILGDIDTEIEQDLVIDDWSSLEKVIKKFDKHVYVRGTQYFDEMCALCHRAFGERYRTDREGALARLDDHCIVFRKHEDHNKSLYIIFAYKDQQIRFETCQMSSEVFGDKGAPKFVDATYINKHTPRAFSTRIARFRKTADDLYAIPAFYFEKIAKLL